MIKDWQPEAEDLDESWSYKELMRLSEDDAKKMLIENPSTYTELLMYAKGEVFLKHMRVIIDNLLSDDSRGNFALADGFIELCTTKPDLHEQLDLNELSKLKGILEKVASRQSFYDADVDIFGDFYKRISKF
ncbi:hypothetical protein [Pseudomonas indica]|uniref:hypothetical protein n=1 Tax=Pseudomonas indica TaxID=137658 RepID=UPI000BABF982|nr:hypothetical protein [Pseudomonas indica]PAU63086.1 hypothetical protein BZL42_05175 [Pseudomonas indica]